MRQLNFSLYWFLPSLLASCSSGFEIYKNFLGCYKSNEQDSFLNVDINKENLNNLNKTDLEEVVSACLSMCLKQNHMYASIRSGRLCACNSSCCQIKADNCNCDHECHASLVYATGTKVPGRPGKPVLVAASTTSLRISWTRPLAAASLISGYSLEVRSASSLDQRLKVDSEKTTILGLKPGQEYEVVLAGESRSGLLGPTISNKFFTVIGDPLPPPAPQLVHHSNSSSTKGEIKVRLYALDSNPFGPISAYRIIVINETEPKPFDESLLTNWVESQRMGLNYWIAAEILPDWFDGNEVFAVGDNKVYNGFLNHGPLDAEKFDFHVSAGTVSSRNNITKVSYAEVGHEQHAAGNIIILHHNIKDHHNHHDHHHHDDHYHHRDDHHKMSWLDHVLLIAIVIIALLLVILASFYLFLRLRDKKRIRYTSGLQLRMRNSSSSNETMLAFDNEVASDKFNRDAIHDHWIIDDEQVEQHQIVGRGVFGAVHCGVLKLDHQNKRICIQHAQQSDLATNNELYLDRLRLLDHPHVVLWLGTTHASSSFVTEAMADDISLKSTLLNLRHSKNANTEQVVSKWLLGIATGMSYLERNRIRHEALCCRNIMIDENQRAKVSGFSLVQINLDRLKLSRWHNESKESLWSFGILVWEALAMGGTPYADQDDHQLKSSHLRNLKRLPGVSEQLNDIISLCCSSNDERSFGRVQGELVHVVNDHQETLSFATNVDHYEPYVAEYELWDTGTTV